MRFHNLKLCGQLIRKTNVSQVTKLQVPCHFQVLALLPDLFHLSKRKATTGLSFDSSVREPNEAMEALHWLSFGSIQWPGTERVAVQCANPAFQPPHGRCNSLQFYLNLNFFHLLTCDARKSHTHVSTKSWQKKCLADLQSLAVRCSPLQSLFLSHAFPWFFCGHLPAWICCELELTTQVSSMQSGNREASHNLNALTFWQGSEVSQVPSCSRKT